jgi:hypothetical protein
LIRKALPIKTILPELPPRRVALNVSRDDDRGFRTPDRGFRSRGKSRPGFRRSR